MDAYSRKRQIHTNRTTSYNVVAADDTTSMNNMIAVRSANFQLFIQRIRFAPTTYSAKTLTFQDDAGTPVPIGLMSIPAAAGTTGGDDQFLLDYGADGAPLTAGKNLDVVASAAGVAGRLIIEAYEKPVSGALNLGVAASVQ